MHGNGRRGTRKGGGGIPLRAVGYIMVTVGTQLGLCCWVGINMVRLMQVGDATRAGQWGKGWAHR